MPRIFFGSSKEVSKECSDLAAAVCDGWAEPVVWMDAIPVGSTTLQALLDLARTVDFAVFLLSGEDEVTSRGITSRAPRDNLVFESGIFIANTGLDRIALVVPEPVPKLSSDLAGYTYATYKESAPAEFRFGDAVRKIREAFRQRWDSATTDRRAAVEVTVPGASSIIEDNLDAIRWADLTTLSLVCHTGTTLFGSIEDRLKRAFGHPERYPELRVLLRVPSIEGVGRTAAIVATVQRIHQLRGRGARVDVRFYEGLPMFRGFAFTTKADGADGRLHVRHSSYAWNDHGISKRSRYHFIEEYPGAPASARGEPPREARSPAEAFVAWFEHFWGRDEIHTVIFDFDDTLAYTGGIQIEAWAHTIAWALDELLVTPANLTDRIRRWVSDGRVADLAGLKGEITQLFNEYQMAQDIIAHIFHEVPDRYLKQIKDKRFDVRRSMMEGFGLYAGATDCLKELARQHRLAVISSTDERLIGDFLAANHVGDLFSTILGKADPGLHTNRTIEDKAYLFLKLSVLTGIPLSRMVYVGDNRSDFESTRRVGLTFVEARQGAERRGLRSLIGARKNGMPPPEASFNDMAELPRILRELSRAKAKAKWSNY